MTCWLGIANTIALVAADLGCSQEQAQRLWMHRRVHVVVELEVHRLGMRPSSSLRSSFVSRLLTRCGRTSRKRCECPVPRDAIRWTKHSCAPSNANEFTGGILAPPLCHTLTHSSWCLDREQRHHQFVYQIEAKSTSLTRFKWLRFSLAHQTRSLPALHHHAIRPHPAHSIRCMASAWFSAVVRPSSPLRQHRRLRSRRS